MKDPYIDELLAYKNPLEEAGFNRAVIEEIQQANQQRKRIVASFTFVGLCMTVVYLLAVLPADVGVQLLTPVNGLLLSSIGLFVIWLWTDALASD